jgi:CRP-like cAMP-binding protein
MPDGVWKDGKRPWSRDDIKTLKQRIKENRPYREIAQELNRGIRACRFMAARLRCQKYRAKFKKGELDEAVRRLYKTGVTDAEVAEELGCCKDAVLRCRKRLGIKTWVTPSVGASIASRWKHFKAGTLKTMPRESERTPAETLERVYKLLDEKLDHVTVADRTGVPRKRVSKIAKRRKQECDR